MPKQTETGGDDEVLYGWKAIAGYLGCSIKTAHRREEKEGLPILRPVNRQKGRVLALKRSLLAWMTGGIESAVIAGNSLLAFNRRTQVLWSYVFQHPLRTFSSEELEWRLKIVDLNGIGEQGVLLTTQFQDAAIPDTLLYFSPDGKIVWQLDADPPVSDREGRSFERAWRYKHVVITPSLKKGHLVWAALGNDAGWAGCVLRIDALGDARVQFTNAGYVEKLCPVTVEGRDFLIICGENNDYDDAFVALLAEDDPAACSVPGERLVYRFSNPPSGVPRKYILFPTTELIQARLKPYGHATHIAQHRDGLIIEVETGADGAHFRYHFSRDLDPRYVFPSGSHEFVHQKLEKTGAIPHTWARCPELQAPLILRIWEPDSGWYERPIPWRDNPWLEIQSANA